MTSPTPSAEMIERARGIRRKFEQLLLDDYDGARIVAVTNEIEQDMIAAFAAEAALALEQLGVVGEFAAERKRQIEEEGWTAQHDAAHEKGDMARAAGWYAICAWLHGFTDCVGPTHPDSIANKLFAHPSYGWPWHLIYWKPKNPRRDLIRAGALIVAEIERLDRRSLIPSSAPEKK